MEETFLQNRFKRFFPGLGTILTESLSTLKVDILHAFELFCTSEDHMPSESNDRFNAICLIIFNIERYVSFNLATEIKANNILRPFIDECPSEREVMELFYSAVTNPNLTSPRPYLNENAPLHEVLRSSPPTLYSPRTL